MRLLGSISVSVLVGFGEMPTREELPSSITELASRNAAELRPGREFQKNLDELIEQIERMMPSKS